MSVSFLHMIIFCDILLIIERNSLCILDMKLLGVICGKIIFTLQFAFSFSFEEYS